MGLYKLFFKLSQENCIAKILQINIIDGIFNLFGQLIFEVWCQSISKHVIKPAAEKINLFFNLSHVCIKINYMPLFCG